MASKRQARNAMMERIVEIQGIVRRRDSQVLDVDDFVIDDSMFPGDGATE